MECAVCTTEVHGLDWCMKHWTQYKEAIMNNEPWVRVLKNDRQNERRRILREMRYVTISLDAFMDKEYCNDD